MPDETILVLHHNDLDGESSAAVIIAANAGAQVTCIPIDYKDPVPFDLLPDYGEVYIVDFSLGQQGAWEQAIASSNKLIWIDHHASAIKNAPPEAHALPGVREEGQDSACILAWRYLFATSYPKGLVLISDYDSWTHAYTESRPFKAGLEAAWDTRPSEGHEDTWKRLLHPVHSERRYFCEEVIRLGERIMRKTALRNAALVEAWGYPVEFEGFGGIALNRNQVGSDAFASVAEKYDLLLPYIFDGERYTVSIYRGASAAGIDCAELAERYGGGGHPGAAGFQCKALPWE